MAAANVLQRTKAALDTVGAAQLSQLFRGPAAAALNWQQPAEAAKATPRHQDAVPAMVFLGPPGVGKGTYSTRVAEHFGVAHISAGDLARDEMRAGTTRGRQVHSKCQLLTPERWAFQHDGVCPMALCVIVGGTV